MSFISILVTGGIIGMLSLIAIFLTSSWFTNPHLVALYFYLFGMSYPMYIASKKVLK